MYDFPLSNEGYQDQRGSDFPEQRGLSHVAESNENSLRTINKNHVAEYLWAPEHEHIDPENQWLEDCKMIHFLMKMIPFVADMLIFGGGPFFVELFPPEC